MFSENDKISIRQLQALLILDLFGTGVVTLPRQTVNVAGNDAYIAVLLGSIIMAVFTLVFTILGQRYTNKTVVEISQMLLSRPVGLLLSLGLAIKIMIGAGLELRIFCEMIGQSMLFRTPIFITALAMLLICSYVSAIGYECRARTGEILFVFVFVPFLILMFLAIFTADYSNLRPVLSHSASDIAKGTWYTILSFQGLEFLFLVFPYLQCPKRAKKGMLQAGLIIAFFMTLITLLTIAVFGQYSVTNKLFPVLQMMDSLQLPGSFLDRQDIFMLWFWVVSIFASVSAALFFVTILFERIQQNKNKKIPARKWMLFVMVIVFLVAILPQDVASTHEYMERLKKYGGTFYILILPVVLFVIDNIKRRKQV
ncbi:MAG: endospore germination permease [Firmicutes bacterium]|nr:endospore germination permease [Bacillota bacterium]